jgi:hypothetical protein
MSQRVRTAAAALALSLAMTLHAQTPPAVEMEWVRSSYHNGVKHGGIGIGVGLARRGEERSLIVELLSIRPIRLDRLSSLRLTGEDGASIELEPAADAWGVASSVGTRVQGFTAYTSRLSYPVTLAQLQQLRAANKVTLEAIHDGGAASVRLRGAETEAIWKYASAP